MGTRYRSSRSSRLAGALCLVVIAAPSASAQDGDDPAGRLRGGEIQVRILSPTRADVEARFQVDAGQAPLELMLSRFPGQTLAGATLTVNARTVSLAPVPTTAVDRIPVPMDDREITVRYELEGDPESAFRFALPVPSALPAEDARIGLRVAIPAGSFATGDEFPRFERIDGGESYAADLPAVPAFVRFGFDDEPPGAFGIATRFEIISLAVVVLPLAVWALWRRRDAGDTGLDR